MLQGNSRRSSGLGLMSEIRMKRHPSQSSFQFFWLHRGGENQPRQQISVHREVFGVGLPRNSPGDQPLRLGHTEVSDTKALVHPEIVLHDLIAVK